MINYFANQHPFIFACIVVFLFAIGLAWLCFANGPITLWETESRTVEQEYRFRIPDKED